MPVFRSLALAAIGCSYQVMCSNTVARRDATVLDNTLDTIRTRMIDADNSLLAYHGGSPAELRHAAQSLYHTIDDGVKVMQGLDGLSMEDVVAITPGAGRLSEVGTKFLTDLGDSAHLFGTQGLCSSIYQYSLNLGRVSQDFFTAAKTKFPAEGQQQADEEIQHNKELFAKCQAALAPGACVDLVPAPTNHNFTSPHTTSVSWQTSGPNHGNGPDHPQPTSITGAANTLSLPITGVVLASVLSWVCSRH